MSGELTPVGQGDLAPRRPAVPPAGWGGAGPGGWTPPPSRPTPDDEIDLREVWAILRRNWWIVAGCTALGLLAAFAYVKLATPIYRSSTTLQFQEKGSTVPVLDALRDLQGGTEVGTEMEVLRSRSLAEAVIDSLGLQVLVSGAKDARRGEVLAAVQADADAPESRVRLVRGEDGRFSAELREGEYEGELGVAAPGEPLRLPGATVVLAPGAAELERVELEILPRTLAAERFGEALGVSRPNRDANVVQVRFDAPDPELARDVANVLAHQYLVRRNAVQKVSDRSTVDFLRSQVDTLQVQLRSAEEAVRRFREENRVVSLEAEAEAQVERLTALQAQRAELEGERGALAGLLAEARAAEGGVGEGPSPYRRLLAFPSLLRNQTTSTLLQALTVRETELAQLRVRRTPADPDVQAVAAQLRNLEEQAAAVVTTYLGGLANQVEAIDRELAGFGERLAQVPAKEVEYARLERSARVLADIYTLLQTRLKEAEVVEAVQDASVRVVDVAVVGGAPIRPRPSLTVSLGLVLGSVGGFVVLLLTGVADRRLQSPDQLESWSGAPTLAVIPELSSQSGRLRSQTPHSTEAAYSRRSSRPHLIDSTVGSEIIGTLRTNLQFLSAAVPHRVILITSASPGEGKSDLTVSLAFSFAQMGCRTLLIDGDIRHPRLDQVLRVERRPGLTDVLAGRTAESDAITAVGGADTSDLWFMPAGSPVLNAPNLLGSHAWRDVVDRLRSQYDLILVDSAPALLFADASLLGQACDSAVIVARAGKVRVAEVTGVAERLRGAGVRLAGFVLNGANPARVRGHLGSMEDYAKYNVFPGTDPVDGPR